MDALADGRVWQFAQRLARRHGERALVLVGAGLRICAIEVGPIKPGSWWC
jgi:hypothetical protein